MRGLFLDKSEGWLRVSVLHESATALRAQDRLAKLAPRERQVFDLIGAGYKTHAIADVLGLSERTIDCYRRNIRDKLRIATAADLSKVASAAVTQKLREALEAAARDLETVADLAGHSTPAGAHALSSIERIAAVAERAS